MASNLYENINKEIKKRGLSQGRLEQAIGLSNGIISKWKGSSPTIDKIQLIADYFNVSVDYLMNGYDLNSDSDSKYTKIPLLGSIHAGVSAEAIEYIEDYEDIPSEWLRGEKEYFALRVKGDSMEPDYYEDDVIIILKATECNNGDVCAVGVNGNEAILRKVLLRQDGILLQPHNHEYPPQFYPYGEDCEPVTIYGIVVELRRTMRKI